jgi:hypothetical protein
MFPWDDRFQVMARKSFCLELETSLPEYWSKVNCDMVFGLPDQHDNMASKECKLGSVQSDPQPVGRGRAETSCFRGGLEHLQRELEAALTPTCIPATLPAEHTTRSRKKISSYDSQT